MHDEDLEVGYVGARFGSPSVRKRLREERRRAKAKPPDPVPEPAPVPVPEPEPEPVWPEYVDSSSLVRPYARTGGRTEAGYDLRLETLISADEVNLYRATNDQLPMMRLCVHPRSVAEIAALSNVPLGVARVLLSDLIALGLVAVHERELPDMSLLERVLAGLHRL